MSVSGDDSGNGRAGEHRRKGPRFNGNLMDVFEVSRDLVCLCRQGIITAVNTSGLRLLGADRGDIVRDRRFVEFLIPEYAEVFEFFLSGDMSDVEPIPTRILTLDGSIKDVELQVFRAREIACDAAVVIGRDVSREGRLAGHARDNRARYTALVDNAMNLVCHVVDGAVHYINRSGCLLLGAADAGPLAGRALADLLHDDYAELVAPGQIDLLLAEMGPVAMRLKRLDGTAFDAQVMICRLPSDQGEELMVEACDISAHIHTVTALRQSTETLLKKSQEMQELQAALAAREIGIVRRRLSEAQRVARIGTMERDGHGFWQLCPHASSLLDLAHRPRITLDDLLARISGTERHGVMTALAAFPASPVNIEFPVLNGEEARIVHAVGNAMMGADDEAFITVQDVTTRRAVEREHAQMRARAEEASRLESLGTLAGGIAHEINTPAQFVGDNLQFIETGAKSLLEVAHLAKGVAIGQATLEELAARISCVRLDFLSQEIPAAAKEALDGMGRISAIVQAVKETCYPSAKIAQPFDLNHTVESVVTVTRNTWKYVAELELRLDSGLPPINAIEGEINQVVMNLVINAAHAVEEKGTCDQGLIQVSTRAVAGGVVLSVSDNGVGIPPGLHQKIFDLFFTTKPPGSGTGQGLAISAAIIRRHGGRIDVCSEAGQGARFDVHLPLNPPLP